jgi:hypothetical protein
MNDSNGDGRRDGQCPAPRLRLGKHDDWLPLDLVQAVIDLMYDRQRGQLAALIGEAMTGEKLAVSHRRAAR